jgi:hypothetical protein
MPKVKALQTQSGSYGLHKKDQEWLVTEKESQHLSAIGIAIVISDEIKKTDEKEVVIKEPIKSSIKIKK